MLGIKHFDRLAGRTAAYDGCRDQPVFQEALHIAGNTEAVVDLRLNIVDCKRIRSECQFRHGLIDLQPVADHGRQSQPDFPLEFRTFPIMRSNLAGKMQTLLPVFEFYAAVNELRRTLRKEVAQGMRRRFTFDNRFESVSGDRIG